LLFCLSIVAELVVMGFVLRSRSAAAPAAAALALRVRRRKRSCGLEDKRNEIATPFGLAMTNWLMGSQTQPILRSDVAGLVDDGFRSCSTHPTEAS
jgi:hypothetical protein